MLCKEPCYLCPSTSRGRVASMRLLFAETCAFIPLLDEDICLLAILLIFCTAGICRQPTHAPANGPKSPNSSSWVQALSPHLGLHAAPFQKPLWTQGSTPESHRRWGAAIFCHPSQGRQAQQLSCFSNTLYRSLCVITFWDCLQWSPSRAKYAASYLVHHYLQKNTLWLRSSLYRANGTETTAENNVL